MKIGSHTIGDYPALIKVMYDDGSVSYDSSYGFENEADFMESYTAILSVMNKGLPLYDGRKIAGAVPIRGLEAVRAALTAYYGGGFFLYEPEAATAPYGGKNNDDKG